MKKYKIITIFILFVTFCLFVSCSKETTLKNSNQDVINAFTKHLTESINKFAGSHTKSASPEFSENPYDSAGIIHNQIVGYLYENKYMEKDFSYLVEGVCLYSGLKIDENDFYNWVVEMIKGVYNKDKSYNPGYVNNLGKEMPQLEKEILNSYFGTISKIEDVDSRIAVSKEMERFVLNSKDYTTDLKERLLSTFSVYRHSTHFWNDKVDYGLPNPATLDAAAERFAREVGGDIGCNDGKDVYHFAGAMSFAMFQIAVFLPGLFDSMFS